MGRLLHLVQRGGAWAGCGHVQSPPHCTKCNSPPINGQCTIALYDGPLLCGFNVAIKGLTLYNLKKNNQLVLWSFLRDKPSEPEQFRMVSRSGFTCGLQEVLLPVIKSTGWHGTDNITGMGDPRDYMPDALAVTTLPINPRFGPALEYIGFISQWHGS